MPEIEILADEFYKQPSRESWHKLTQLIEGIKWIIDSFVIIDNNPELKDIVNSYEEWNLYAKDIHELSELMGGSLKKYWKIVTLYLQQIYYPMK